MEKSCIHQLHAYFLQEKKSLAFAESCTGGLLSYLITKNPGASNYFLGSFVTYASKLKQQILHVQDDTLIQEGAVSEKCVEEMVLGLYQQTKADWNLAISGYMGPNDEETGLVYLAIAKQGNILFKGKLEHLHESERISLMEESANRALEYLFKVISMSAKISS
ncbi:MAG: CinA family protein [Chlamydiae bacterium]|nr:CinA family protein [Chlamydiota bacterium]